MINRFRLEGTGFTRDQCLAILMDGVEALWVTTNTTGPDWDVTQEVITKGTDEIYHGRIVCKRKPVLRED